MYFRQRPIGAFPSPKRSSIAAHSGSLEHFVTASWIVVTLSLYVFSEQNSFSLYVYASNDGRESGSMVAEAPVNKDAVRNLCGIVMVSRF